MECLLHLSLTNEKTKVYSPGKTCTSLTDADKVSCRENVAAKLVGFGGFHLPLINQVFVEILSRTALLFLKVNLNYLYGLDIYSILINKSLYWISGKILFKETFLFFRP